MRILGVDPSLANWGMVLADYSLDSNNEPKITLKVAQTVVTNTEAGWKARQGKRSKLTAPPKYLDNLNRARKLFVNFQEWEDLADVIVAEIPTGSQAYKAALSQGICLGILSAARKPLICVSPYDVKFVLGERTVPKEDIHAWVSNKHPGVIDPTLVRGTHQADATIAIYAALDKLKEFYNANSFSTK